MIGISQNQDQTSSEHDQALRLPKRHCLTAITLMAPFIAPSPSSTLSTFPFRGIPLRALLLAGVAVSTERTPLANENGYLAPSIVLLLEGVGLIYGAVGGHLARCGGDFLPTREGRDLPKAGG